MNFFKKTPFFLGGVLLTFVILGALTNQFQESGIWMSLVLCIILSGAGFYYTEKGTPLRAISWGTLITTICGTVLYIVFLRTIESALEKIV